MKLWRKLKQRSPQLTGSTPAGANSKRNKGSHGKLRGGSFMKPIRRVAVLGAGTMGSRIAAHLANAGIPSQLLDINAQAARNGLDAALKGKPGAFFSPVAARLIETGSFEDDLPRIASCDWIVEAVSENLAIKRALYDRVIPHRAPEAIV